MVTEVSFLKDSKFSTILNLYDDYQYLIGAGTDILSVHKEAAWSGWYGHYVVGLEISLPFCVFWKLGKPLHFSMPQVPIYEMRAVTLT